MPKEEYQKRAIEKLVRLNTSVETQLESHVDLHILKEELMRLKAAKMADFIFQQLKDEKYQVICEMGKEIDKMFQEPKKPKKVISVKEGLN